MHGEDTMTTETPPTLRNWCAQCGQSYLDADWQPISVCGASHASVAAELSAAFKGLAALRARLETLADAMRVCGDAALDAVSMCTVNEWEAEIRALLADRRTTP